MTTTGRGKPWPLNPIPTAQVVVPKLGFLTTKIVDLDKYALQPRLCTHLNATNAAFNLELCTVSLKI